jgi:2-polyprenyl-3-methyl-5-hydroxy-6-metoxy-1,4-benzoquinol methylase
MNPQPSAESISDCYPINYGPHRSEEIDRQVDETSAVDMLSPSTKTVAPKPWYMRLGAGHIPGLRAFYNWLADKKSEIIPADAPGKSAIEIGCANGDFLLRLREEGWNVQGIEPAEQAAATARQRGLTVHHGTLESAQLPAASADVLFAWMVIEHLPQPRVTLEQIQRVLKPGGILAFNVPNFGCWEPWIFGRNWDAYELPRHLQHFTPQTITRLLESNGFQDVTIIHQRNLLNVVGSIGFKLRSWKPNSRLATRLIAWPHNPTMWPQLAMAPIAKLLAVLRQGGRLTITARNRGPVTANIDEANV